MVLDSHLLNPNRPGILGHILVYVRHFTHVLDTFDLLDGSTHNSFIHLFEIAKVVHLDSPESK
jgi:hypothetical protein